MGGKIPDGNFPRGKFSRGGGSLMGGNFSGGDFPITAGNTVDVVATFEHRLTFIYRER